MQRYRENGKTKKESKNILIFVKYMSISDYFKLAIIYLYASMMTFYAFVKKIKHG